MLEEAKRYEEEDKIEKKKIEAKNSLESYVYSMKSQVEDTEKLAEKISNEEKELILEHLDEVEEWLEDQVYEEMTKEDYEDKLKELEEVFGPIIQGAYAAGDGVDDVGYNDYEEEDIDDIYDM